MSIPLATVAKKRGWQTFLQGLAVDVAVTVAVFILANVNAITDRGALLAALVSLGKSIVAAVAAYVIRRYRDKSGVEPIAPNH